MDGDAALAEKAPSTSEVSTTLAGKQFADSDPAVHQAILNAHAIVSHTQDGKVLIQSARGDPDSPRSWPNWKRYGIVILASFLNNLVTICVSGYSTGTAQMEQEFGVSEEVGTLGLSTFILGFASGPMLVAPLSEFYGRRPVYLICWALFVIFQIPVAVAPNIATVLVCRFFQGFFGSTPLANTGGVVHDLFGRDEGGYAVAIYALSSTNGPPFGNLISGFIAQEKGWRWLFWVYLIIFGAFWFVIYFFLPETRGTIIMMRKAKRLRAETGNPNIYAAHEQDRSSAGRLWKVSLFRPIKFLFTEPITYYSAIINALTFGIIFLANEAFPLVFGPGNNGHGWTHSGVVNLTYGSFVIGAFIGFALQPFQERFYRNRLALNGGKSDPEARWGSALFGIFLLPIGLFIAAWTSYPTLPWIAPCIGFTIFGIGFYVIIMAILNYVVDGYGHYSASSLAGVVMVRNIAGAAFPLFARQMYVALGNQWATCLLAFLALLLVPIPFWLFFKGKSVRYNSPYCREHFEEED
ncbi:MFS general substrate transporter [Athelia psychrophila]|uniref:MFS general substrate transporter n=1 Tax=Athelia psychrophila TaxID=1759441 RepID=A0A166TDR8_9AGAM|nr:MFS general substrate transporter [Fibularhizoctonia sp. CBS 109695]